MCVYFYVCVFILTSCKHIIYLHLYINHIYIYIHTYIHTYIFQPSTNNSIRVFHHALCLRDDAQCIKTTYFFDEDMQCSSGSGSGVVCPAVSEFDMQHIRKQKQSVRVYKFVTSQYTNKEQKRTKRVKRRKGRTRHQYDVIGGGGGGD